MRRTNTKQLKKPAIAPYHQTSESPGLKNHNIAVAKPDKIISSENIKPCFFVNMLLVALREIVVMSDDRNRQPAKPVIAPNQDTSPTYHKRLALAKELAK